MNSLHSLRADAARHTRLLLKHYTREAPKLMAAHGDLLHPHLVFTVEDVLTLESHAAECGRQGGYWERFKASTYHEAFFPSLLQFADYPINKVAAKPFHQRGINDPSAWIVYRFREMLRNGASIEDALRTHGKAIGKQLAQGDVWLLSALAAAQRTPPRRSFQDWILKAWLPLALWKDSEAKEKRKSLKAAYSLLRAVDAEIFPLPRSDAAITKAIGTAASKLRRRVR